MLITTSLAEHTNRSNDKVITAKIATTPILAPLMLSPAYVMKSMINLLSTIRVVTRPRPARAHSFAGFRVYTMITVVHKEFLYFYLISHAPNTRLNGSITPIVPSKEVITARVTLPYFLQSFTFKFS